MASVEQIITLLRSASKAYYNGGPLEMDDDTYDGLIERLKSLDPENPYLLEVGAPPAEGAVQLPHPMPSLNKIKPGEDALGRFLGSKGPFVLSEKLDGLSALWLPKSGALYLRGDGLMGVCITHLIALGLLGLIKTGKATAVRGEIILPRSAGEPLARSWVNGVIHRKTIVPEDVAKMRFVAYEVVEPAAVNRSQQLAQLKKDGYEVPWNRTVAAVTEEVLKTYLQERRKDSPYDTDGIVVAQDAVAAAVSTAGAHKATNPKDVVAFKMPLADQSAETVVREVLWAPSAQGYLIPRIRFDPVKIGSATIEFCTGHNARMIYASKVGPGAQIVIRRSGDVIPKLDRVLTATTASFPPADTWEWIGAAETAVHIRTTAGGDAVATAKLHHFLKTLDIPGAGPATATALVAGGVRGPAALWATPATKLSELLGPKTGAALYANIRTAATTVTEQTLMIASSMMPRGVGDTKLRALFGVESNPTRWATLAAAPAGWSAEAFQQFLKELPTYLAWRATELGHMPAFPVGSKPAAAAAAAQAPADKGLICLTGFRDKTLEETAVKGGYRVSTVFTNKVTILLVPDGEVKESEKIRVAKARGTRILTRSQFVAQHLSSL